MTNSSPRTSEVFPSEGDLTNDFSDSEIYEIIQRILYSDACGGAVAAEHMRSLGYREITPLEYRKAIQSNPKLIHFWRPIDSTGSACIQTRGPISGLQIAIDEQNRCVIINDSAPIDQPMENRHECSSTSKVTGDDLESSGNRCEEEEVSLEVNHRILTLATHISLR